MIAVAGLLAGCQKSQTYPPNGNLTPVNEAAMATPAALLPATGTEAGGTPSPSPGPATGGASPGG